MAEITSNKAPNKHTEGVIGDIYNVNGVKYECVRIIKTTIDEFGNQEFIYEWEREYVGGGDSSIDMTDYQTIEDNSLIANDKTIVGAINELNDMVNETAVGTRVLEYVTNKPGSYPTFDATFSANCTTEIINNNDGTYTHIVYQTNPDILPTSISFKNNTNLLSLSYANTSNVTNMHSMFNGCSALTSLDVSSFDTTNVKNMYAMFYGCSALTSLDVSSFNTSNVTDMRAMFNDCKALTSLDVSGFDTSNVTNMNVMFNGCNTITSLDLSSFDTSNVASMRAMFNACSALTSLDVSSFDTTNVTSMHSMFNGCSAITSLDVSNFNTSNVTSMYAMFNDCSALTSLDVSGFDTTNVTNMGNMFNGCNALTSLDVSSFDTTNVTDMSYMFSGCISITDLEPPQNLKITHSISSMTLLPAQELVQWLNALPTVTNSPTITIGTTLSSKLTAEEIAIATNKGWVVS